MIAPADRALRVLHVLHSLHAGGAERIVCDLARRRSTELAVSVVCLDQLGPLADEARRLDVAVYCTRRREGFDYRQIGRIAGLIRRIRPDVIHAHQYTPYVYTALAASAVGVGPIVFTEHGRHWPDEVSTLRQAVNQVLRLRRDRVTAVCRFAATALQRKERIAGREIRVIPNGVACERFGRPARPAWLAELTGAAPGAPLLIQVARFHRVKDHETSLRAFGIVRSAHPDARLILVGDGPDGPRLRDLAADLGIAEGVVMLGLRNDVPDLLAASTVFVLSSLSEAASLSILEAMAAGLPVVATDVGGNAELVQHGVTGLLSPRRDPQALAENLIALLADTGLRRQMGQAGRQRARTYFDQRRMHQAFVDLYRQVAGRSA